MQPRELCLLLTLGAALGCGGGGAASSTQVGPTPAKPERPISMVTSAIVVESCPDSKMLSSKQASKEIQELVGACTHVPGGEAQFSATMHPDGRIELAAPSNDPSGGVVPTCVVQNAKQIRHRLKVRSACTVDVTLTEHNR